MRYELNYAGHRELVNRMEPFRRGRYHSEASRNTLIALTNEHLQMRVFFDPVIRQLADVMDKFGSLHVLEQQTISELLEASQYRSPIVDFSGYQKESA